MDINSLRISGILATEIFKNKIIIRKLMKVKRGKIEEGEFEGKNPLMEEEEDDFLNELDLEED